MSLNKAARNAAVATAVVVTAVVAIIQGLRQRSAEHERTLAALPLKERGAALMQDVGCTDCHQAGSAFRAPILTGLLGKTVTLQDGSQVVADAAYVLRSIADPKAQVVRGYQAVMPSYQARLSKEDLEAIVEAMK